MKAKYYGKKMSRAEMKMETAIWNHGAKKRDLTNAIRHIEKTGFQNNPIIKPAIEFLKLERKKLDSVTLF